MTKAAMRLGQAASSNILQMLVNDRQGLVRESASFIRSLEKLWKINDLSPDLIWAELDERIRLADELRTRGIRPKKGRKYRSTKLP
ncbi:hypothetical protein [Swingsia samuiensis]|nr:hypothetical protein [Swingsia samuiensis]